jgi:hypothetical protein
VEHGLEYNQNRRKAPRVPLSRLSSRRGCLPPHHHPENEKGEEKVREPTLTKPTSLPWFPTKLAAPGGRGRRRWWIAVGPSRNQTNEDVAGVVAVGRRRGRGGGRGRRRLPQGRVPRRPTRGPFRRRPVRRPAQARMGELLHRLARLRRPVPGTLSIASVPWSRRSRDRGTPASRRDHGPRRIARADLALCRLARVRSLHWVTGVARSSRGSRAWGEWACDGDEGIRDLGFCFLLLFRYT